MTKHFSRPRNLHYGPITYAIRVKIVVEYNKLLSISKVAKNLKIDKKTVRKYVKIYENTDSVDTPPRKTRKKDLITVRYRQACK